MRAAAEPRADIDDDDDIRAHLPRDIDGQVVGDAAVHQQSAVDFDRREEGGNRHAGAERADQFSLVQNDGLAGFNVGGDGPEGNVEFVEIGGVFRVQQKRFQDQIQILPLQ